MNHEAEASVESPRLTALMADLRESKTMRERWSKLEAFQAMLNQPPPPGAIESTPDGKARTMVISHVETTLDVLYIGQWSTSDFAFTVVGNELAGQLTLSLTHPITGGVRTIVGVAAQAIMMDAAPTDLNGQEKNLWSQNIANKKSKALKMNLPALKSECLKNAAQQIGRAFGRDLNRKNAAAYEPRLGKVTRLPKTFMDGAKAEIAAGKTTVQNVLDRLENAGIEISKEQLRDLAATPVLLSQP